MRWQLRAGTVADVQFLGAMMYEAGFPPTRPKPPLDEALRLPHVAAWLDRWGRAGDAAVIAEEPDGRPVGAAFHRLYRGDEPGIAGVLDAATPVLAIATVPDRRGLGVGGQLLAALIEQARAAGHVALSLSVGRTNPALRLYERHGFRAVSDGNGPLVLRLPLA
jgi:GNAT superfamily N-acetyltransferase